jgi:hypothetical protein
MPIIIVIVLTMWRTAVVMMVIIMSVITPAIGYEETARQGQDSQ